MSRNGRASAVAVAQHDDLAGLLDDEQQLREARRPGHIDGAVEVADPLQRDPCAPPWRCVAAVVVPAAARRPGGAAGGERDQGEEEDDEAGADAASHPRERYLAALLRLADFDDLAGVGDFRFGGCWSICTTKEPPGLTPLAVFALASPLRPASTP